MASLEAIRTAGEADLERRIAKLSKRHRAMVLAAVETFGSVAAVPQSVWDEIQRDIENETAAVLLLLILSSDTWTAQQIRRQGMPIAEPDGRAITGYAMQAAGHSQRLGEVLSNSIRNRLGAIEAELRRNGLPPTEITNGVRKELGKAISPNGRAPGIITTTTGAMSNGQMEAGRRSTLPPPSVPVPTEPKMVQMIWRTERDDRVCLSYNGGPGCASLDNTPPMTWGQIAPYGPPLHIGCRCILYPKVEAITARGAA